MEGGEAEWAVGRMIDRKGVVVEEKRGEGERVYWPDGWVDWKGILCMLVLILCENRVRCGRYSHDATLS